MEVNRGRCTTKDRPANRLRHGGRWPIAVLVSCDAASASSNKAGTMNAAQTDHRLMTHSDQTCPPQWVRQWHRQALAQLKELAN